MLLHYLIATYTRNFFWQKNPPYMLLLDIESIISAQPKMIE